jgi:poly(3-hydroxybutyrate) depolymerase
MSIRAFAWLIVGVVVGSASSPGAAVAQTWTDFQVGGVTRRALVYVPSGIDKPPLLISLHGRGIPASWNQGGMMKFEPIADREKFIVVYPEALMDLNWDLGGTTDLDFIRQIVDDMAEQHGVDRNRVYASGFSMGGMFSYTLACKAPDLIAAIAPGNGYPLGGPGRFGCDDSRPVPIFHMHGTADDFVAYSGIHAYLQSWTSAYGCPAMPVETRPYPESNPSSQSFKESWGPCMNDSGQRSEVVLVSVTGMIHDWATAGKANANEDPAFNGKPFDIDGSEEAWAFLKHQSLEGGDDMMGTGGTGAADAGAAGSGGGMGGAGGVGGAAGTSSGGMGGAGAGGTGVSMAGSGGVPSSSGGVGGAAAGAGGSPSFMGTAGQAVLASDPASSDSGCACRAAGAPGRAAIPLALILGLGTALWSRSASRRRYGKAMISALGITH